MRLKLKPEPYPNLVSICSAPTTQIPALLLPESTSMGEERIKEGENATSGSLALLSLSSSFSSSLI